MGTFGWKENDQHLGRGTSAVQCNHQMSDDLSTQKCNKQIISGICCCRARASYELSLKALSVAAPLQPRLEIQIDKQTKQQRFEYVGETRDHKMLGHERLLII